ncbi:MAG: heme-binding domain-containing protein [Armatimonadetes bacterium]|nr:heme-binding domain-containing protein [Armatimonadota bacterium]
MKVIILRNLAILLIVIQLIPYGRRHDNPPVVSEPNWDSPDTRELFYQACKDCHSNETTWPWYSHIAPVSWLVQHDVNDGREHFNVSEWGVQKKNEGEEAAEELREGEMPPWFYYIPRLDKKLSKLEMKKLNDGLIATFGEELDHGDHDDDDDKNDD